MPPDETRLARFRAMRVNLAVSLVILVGKIFAYAITGSAALFADAAESVVHCGAAGFAAFSLWFASRPADLTHPYGHGRIEYLSVASEGLLVVSAGVVVTVTGVLALVRGPQIQSISLGLVIAGSVAVMNLLVGLYLLRVARQHRSIVLEGSGKHVLSDVFTTAAAIGGLLLVGWTGKVWLDPAVAVVLGGYILVSGLGLVRKSLAGLLDELDSALASSLVDALHRAVSEKRIAGFHHLRCRRIGDDVWIELHVMVPGELSVDDAHDRITAMEAELREAIGISDAHFTTHIEPADHESAHPKGHEGVSDPVASVMPRDDDARDA